MVISADDLVGGDDIIFTGVTGEGLMGDIVHGGYGDDRIYGEGEATDRMYGELGDDLIDGGAGDDYIWGDDFRDGDSGDMNTGLMWGHDTLYGGDGVDKVYGGHGDDYIFGGMGDDYLYGHSGEDTIWGEDGVDTIYTGSGWDTVFGGAGCDTIYSEDGGDIIWLGTCEEGTDQTVTVKGTGADPENYTVIMDFWDTDTTAFNMLCLEPDAGQGMPTSGECTINENTTDNCLSYVNIMSGSHPAGNATGVMGAGCKNDGGPLWVTVQLMEGTDSNLTVWGRIF